MSEETLICGVFPWNRTQNSDSYPSISLQHPCHHFTFIFIHTTFETHSFVLSSYIYLGHVYMIMYRGLILLNHLWLLFSIFSVKSDAIFITHFLRQLAAAKSRPFPNPQLPLQVSVKWNVYVYSRIFKIYIIILACRRVCSLRSNVE